MMEYEIATPTESRLAMTIWVVIARSPQGDEAIS
jgi:hypothetical protein